MCLVSGLIAENFEVFENDIFDCKVLMGGRQVTNGILSVSSFSEVCSAVISVNFLGSDVCLWLPAESG